MVGSGSTAGLAVTTFVRARIDRGSSSAAKGAYPVQSRLGSVGSEGGPAEYRPEWAEPYRVEAGRIRRALEGDVDAIEHIGSTAVPSLLTKPIIHLAARSNSRVGPFSLARGFAPLDSVRHDRGAKNHAVYLRVNDAGQRTHILHVFTAERWTSCNQRLFRDKLLHDVEAR